MYKRTRKCPLTCVFTVVVAFAVAAVGFPQHALAEPTPGGDGQQVGVPAPDSKAEKAREKAKRQAADDFVAEQSRNRAEPMAAYLNLRHYGQTRSWWCGPATAAMIIRQWHNHGKIPTVESQYHPGLNFSQTHLAYTQYLDAENDGTYRTHMRRGLNRWMATDWFVVTSNPSASRFLSALKYGIGHESSMAVAALENAGGSHYNNHPSNRTVDHWVAAYGFSGSGGNTRFADAATTIWAGVAERFFYNTTNFTNRFVRPAKAIVW